MGANLFYPVACTTENWNFFLLGKNYWSAQKPVLASDFDWYKVQDDANIITSALGENRSTGLSQKNFTMWTVLLPEPEKPFYRYCYFVFCYLFIFFFGILCFFSITLSEHPVIDSSKINCVNHRSWKAPPSKTGHMWAEVVTWSVLWWKKIQDGYSLVPRHGEE